MCVGVGVCGEVGVGVGWYGCRCGEVGVGVGMENPTLVQNFTYLEPDSIISSLFVQSVIFGHSLCFLLNKLEGVGKCVCAPHPTYPHPHPPPYTQTHSPPHNLTHAGECVCGEVGVDVGRWVWGGGCGCGEVGVGWWVLGGGCGEVGVGRWEVGVLMGRWVWVWGGGCGCGHGESNSCTKLYILRARLYHFIFVCPISYFLS